MNSTFMIIIVHSIYPSTDSTLHTETYLHGWLKHYLYKYYFIYLFKYSLFTFVIYRCFCVSTYSGTWPGGMTILMTSLMSLYFMILSLEVVLVKEGEAFTCQRTLHYPQFRMPLSNTNSIFTKWISNWNKNTSCPFGQR